MRTWNLVLIALVFIFEMTGSTVEAQRIARPFLNVAAPVYQGSILPPVLSVPGIGMPASSLNGHWYPYVIARPVDRQWIRETPMEFRPNRPMHFWGNSRRKLLR